MAIPKKQPDDKPHYKRDFLPWEKELRSLMDKDSRISPSAVLEFAKDDKTALHKCFVWDDTKAAHLFRMDQARHLIARVRVLIIQPPDLRINALIFHSLPGERKKDQGSYFEIKSILASKKYTLQMLEMARQDATTFINKYNFLRNHSRLITKALDALDGFINE